MYIWVHVSSFVECAIVKNQMEISRKEIYYWLYPRTDSCSVQSSILVRLIELIQHETTEHSEFSYSSKLVIDGHVIKWDQVWTVRSIPNIVVCETMPFQCIDDVVFGNRFRIHITLVFMIRWIVGCCFKQLLPKIWKKSERGTRMVSTLHSAIAETNPSQYNTKL